MMQSPDPSSSASSSVPADSTPLVPSSIEEAAASQEFEEIIERTRRSTGRDDKAVMAMFERLRGPSRQLRDGDNSSLRDHLVLLHAPLVEHCARNYVASGEPLEDLLQEGYVGLIKAVDRFDPFKGVRFSTYACHLITGEVRHYLRDLGKLIHEPGWHSELRGKIARAGDSLSQQLARPAAPEEIAEAIGAKADAVRDVLRNVQVLAVDSLDNERPEDSDGDEARRPEIASDARAVEPQVEERVLLRGALPQLKELEKKAIHGFFFEEKSKTQVALELGISVNYAAYLIKQGTLHLREIIEGGALESQDSPSEARAAYLLSLVKKKLWPDPKSSERKRKKSVASGPSLVEFAAWSSVLDDELRRSQRFEQEECLVWLWAWNWDKASARWSSADIASAMEAITILAQGDVRGDDRVGLVPLSSMPDLHVLVALPHTGEAGRIVQERLVSDLRELDFAHADTIEWRSALSVLPQDGPNADALFEALGARLMTDAST